MRPTGSGPLSALLVLAPLVALPILAVIGIPNFAGGNSIDAQNASTKTSARSGSRNAETRLGDAAGSDADDLFAPLEKSDDNGFDDPLRSSKKKKSRSRSLHSDQDEAATDDLGLNDHDFEEREGLQGRLTGTRSRSRTRGRLNSENTEESEDDFGSSTTGGRGTRSRSQNLDGDFGTDSDLALQADENDPTTAKGEQFADASDDFPNPSRGAEQSKRSSRSSDEESATEETGRSARDRESDAGLFEPSDSPKSGRSPAKAPLSNRSPAPRSRPRGPDDAPVFQPPGGSRLPAQHAEPSDFEEPATPMRRQPVQPMNTVREDFERNPESTPANKGSNKSVTAPAMNQQQEMTLKNLFDRLQAVGMTAESHYFTYLEDSESFLFTCTASRPGSSSAPKKFEEEAADPMLAVLKVLKQVQAWQTVKSKPVRGN